MSVKLKKWNKIQYKISRRLFPVLGCPLWIIWPTAGIIVDCVFPIDPTLCDVSRLLKKQTSQPNDSHGNEPVRVLRWPAASHKSSHSCWQVNKRQPSMAFCATLDTALAKVRHLLLRQKKTKTIRSLIMATFSLTSRIFTCPSLDFPHFPPLCPFPSDL